MAGEKKTNMQSLHGKLCVSLYEQFGEECLPKIEETYGDYGRQLGSGFKKKWNIENFEAAGTAFMKMCNAAGLPASIRFEGNTGHWEGSLCPFGLENTHRRVCEAMMAMDLEMMRALTGTEKISMTIEKTLAAGDEICKGTYTLIEE